MILENGVVRTMEPSLPTVRSLAIAGELVAGGVGTHESALPSPERFDLRGRCVLPGFTDSHVHFPTWALAQHEVRLEGTRSLDEALARIRGALAGVETGRWLRGRGWRSGDWHPAVEPTKEALDELAGDTPVGRRYACPAFARRLPKRTRNSAGFVGPVAVPAPTRPGGAGSPYS